MIGDIGGLAAMAGFVCLLGLLSAAVSKKRKRGWFFGFIGLFGLAFALVAVDPPPQQSSNTAEADRPHFKTFGSPDADSTSEPAQAVAANDTPTDAPAPKIVDVTESKHDFLATVDESITGKRIAGNPAKFLGKRVDLHGKVGNVLDEHEFNFDVGSVSVSDSGDVNDTSATIVVTCDSTHDLEADQKLRVIGTVVESTEGTNLMGAQTTFPTVKAAFME